MGHQRDDRHSAQQPSDQPPPPPPHLLSSLIACPPGIEGEGDRKKKKNLTCAYTEIDAAALCGRVIEKKKKNQSETQQPRFQQINPTEYLDRREMGPFHIPLTGLLGFSENYLLTFLGQ